MPPSVSNVTEGSSSKVTWRWAKNDTSLAKVSKKTPQFHSKSSTIYITFAAGTESSPIVGAICGHAAHETEERNRRKKQMKETEERNRRKKQKKETSMKRV